MEITPVDSFTTTLLTIAGAVFAVAGLWLLLRPKASGGTAKIELLGLKFESSSAGVLVFLIGAAFLVLPVVLPRAPDATGPSRAGMAPGIGEAPAEAARIEGPAPTGGERALVLPEKGAEEREPNDTVHEANQLAMGSTARGSGSAPRGAEDRDESDWYVIPVEQAGAFVTLGLRLIDGSGVRANVYDGDERELAELDSRGGVADTEFDVSGTGRLYVRVFPWSRGSNATYEIFSRADAVASGD